MKTIFELHKLYEAKNQRTFTYEQMAGLIGIGERTYSSIASGKTTPGAKTVSETIRYKVANFFGVKSQNISWPTSI